MWRSSCSAISASGRSAPSITKSTWEEPPSSPIGASRERSRPSMRCCISRTSPGFTRSFLAMAPSLAFCMSPVAPSTFPSSRRVRPGEVLEMQQRMEGRDLSLDAPMGEDGGSSHVDFVMDGAELPDAEIAEQEERHIVQERVLEALGRLDPRERYIIEQRIMNDKPMTLKELGEHFGFSRERARQLEIRAKAKLEAELGELMEELFPDEERLAVAETA